MGIKRKFERRAAKAAPPVAVPPAPDLEPVDVQLEDIRTVLDTNPLFRQAVVNAALTRMLAGARAELQAYKVVHDSPPLQEPSCVGTPPTDAPPAEENG